MGSDLNAEFTELLVGLIDTALEIAALGKQMQDVIDVYAGQHGIEMEGLMGEHRFELCGCLFEETGDVVQFGVDECKALAISCFVAVQATDEFILVARVHGSTNHGLHQHSQTNYQAGKSNIRACSIVIL